MVGGISKELSLSLSLSGRPLLLLHGLAWWTAGRGPGGRRKKKKELMGALYSSNYKEKKCTAPNKGREEARGIMEGYIGGGKWKAGRGGEGGD